MMMMMMMMMATIRFRKGFCVIRDLAELECVIWEYKVNLAVIREYYIDCDVGFAVSVVSDLHQQIP